VDEGLVVRESPVREQIIQALRIDCVIEWIQVSRGRIGLLGDSFDDSFTYGETRTVAECVHFDASSIVSLAITTGEEIVVTNGDGGVSAVVACATP
jgi:hypothetical protein